MPYQQSNLGGSGELSQPGVVSKDGKGQHWQPRHREDRAGRTCKTQEGELFAHSNMNDEFYYDIFTHVCNMRPPLPS